MCTGGVELREDRETLYIEPFTNYLSNFCVPDSRYSFVIEDEDPDNSRAATGLDCSSDTDCSGTDGPGTYSVTLKGAESAKGGGKFSTVIEGFKNKSTRSKEATKGFGIPFDDPTCQSSPCQVATPITIGSTAQVGTTSVSAGVPISSVQIAPTCDSGDFGFPATVTAPTGAFYQVIGTGKNLVAYTCTTDFESQISVYNSCDFSQENICETGVSLGGPCNNIGGAQVGWPTNSGQIYYILVHGRSGQTGIFELSVDEVDDDPLACTNAAALALDTPVSETTIGGPTVTGGFSCTYVNLDSPSFNFVTSIFPGVNVAWYKVIGTGNELRAELTYALGAFGGNFAQISLFNSCQDIASSCVGGSISERFTTTGVTTTLVWQSESSVEYYLMVHGRDGSVGNFELSLTDEEL